MGLQSVPEKNRYRGLTAPEPGLRGVDAGAEREREGGSSFAALIPIAVRMGQGWKELETEHESQQASEIEPRAASSVWIDSSDLLFRDLLRAALVHLLAVVRHRLLRGSPPSFSLGDQVVYAQFNRQHAEPKPALAPSASEIEIWISQDLDPFEGVERFYLA